MARRGRKRGGRRAKSIPILPIAPLAIVTARTLQSGASPAGMIEGFVRDTTGYDKGAGKFNAEKAMPFWIGTVAGVVVHKAANKTGINNHVRRATFGYLSL